MTGKQDPSLWELLGLDRNDTVPVLLEELWEHILEIATDPDTPAVDIDLIPHDGVAPESLGNDEFSIEPEPIGYPGTDPDDAGHDAGIGLAGFDDEQSGCSAECDPVFDPADPELGTGDLF